MFALRCPTVPADLAAHTTPEIQETLTCALSVVPFGVWIPAVNVWVATVSAAAEREG